MVRKSLTVTMLTAHSSLRNNHKFEEVVKRPPLFALSITKRAV